MATISKTPSKPTKNIGSLSKVRVLVRVRPFLPHEIDKVSIVSAQFDSPNEASVHLKDQQTSRHECYKLDGFFGQEENNVKEIFEKEVCSLIPGVFRGCNATVFAYGATGSGKTYTMQGTVEQPGLMPLAMSTILSLCQSTGCLAGISYYEVYLDRCYDLLDLKATEISVLDDREGRIHLRGLSQVSVNSMSEFHEILTHGIERRKVAHTGLNDVSSRSHGVLVVTVSTPSENGLEPTLMGKLNLIDLAGNEDNRRSGNEGIRMLESAKINQSLLALSNVIYALNNNKPWVPYRESKLTRILQDSLGGTSHALMVACLSPGDYQESVHTVSLAARSRQISNVVPSAQKQGTPTVRIDMEAKLRVWLESKGKTNTTQRTLPFGSPVFFRAPGSVSSMKKQAVHQGSANTKAANNCTKTTKDRLVPQRKLFESEASSASEIDKIDAKGTISECIVDEIRNESTTCLPDELLEEDEKMAKVSACDVFKSPPYTPKITSCQRPLRKPLSAIKSNIDRLEIDEVLSKDNVLSMLIESRSSTTPFVVTREKFQDFDTPLDKFSARTSNLKSFLVEEYIDFLNAATREELVELKGIGPKRAGYIIELRETSALKSLSDLEKIGLSSKQVHHMFSKAARGMFEEK